MTNAKTAPLGENRPNPRHNLPGVFVYVYHSRPGVFRTFLPRCVQDEDADKIVKAVRPLPLSFWRPGPLYTIPRGTSLRSPSGVHALLFQRSLRRDVPPCPKRRRPLNLGRTYNRFYPFHPPPFSPVLKTPNSTSLTFALERR